MTLKMEIKEEPMVFDDSTVEMMETITANPAHLQHSPSSIITSSFSPSQDANSGIISAPAFIHGNRTPETTESSSNTFHLSSSSADVTISSPANLSVSSPPAVVSPAPSDQNIMSPRHHEIRNNHKERDRSKTNFSIDEILKPSFGHKKLSNSAEEQESAFHQPLDMRMTSTPIESYDGKFRKEQEKIKEDHLCHQYDDNSNNSFTSSNSSPGLIVSDLGNCSSNRFGFDYKKIFGNHNQTLGSINTFANANEFGASLNKLYFPSAMSSHNFSNHLTFGFDVNALRNQIFTDIKLSNYYFQHPQNLYSTFFNEQIHHLNTTDFNKHSKFDNPFLRHDFEPKSTKPLNVHISNNFSTTCKSSEAHMNPSNPAYAREAKTLPDVKPNLSSITPKETVTNRTTSILTKNSSNSNCSKNKNNNNIKGVGSGESGKEKKDDAKLAWPAWVYCTRYSDRPSSGPRYRKPRKKPRTDCDDKRPRTAFSSKQLQRLKYEFEASPYLSETRRKCLALELGLNESQVKIWFQNKRAKLKKCSGAKNLLAMKLMEEGLYNHSTIVVDDNDNGNNKKDDK